MIPPQRHRFSLPRDVAYFNCAYISALLTEAAAAGEAALRRKARPWEIRPADFLEGPERARALFARLIGADAEGVAVTPSAGYGIATAAANLSVPPGKRVLVLKDEFPAQVYPWRRRAALDGGSVHTVSPEPGQSLTEALLAAIDARTAVVACGHLRWTDGALVDVVRVGAAARAAGAALVLDLTQSAGALPIDLARVQPDFVATATYKWLLGPYAMGFLWVAPQHRGGRPLEEGWLGREGAEDFARLVDYQDGYRAGARRFDMGEAPNFALLPVACAALEALIGWGVPAIQATLASRTAAIAARAARLGLAVPEAGVQAGHFLGLGLPPGTVAGLVERLAAAGVHVSVRGPALRITPHLWVDDADVDRLIDALAAAL